MLSPTDLPQLRATVRLGGKDTNVAALTPFYDVKFYPYTPPGTDPVFAVTGGSNTIVCRPVLDRDNSVEVLRWFKDEDPEANINSLAWSQDPETGDPWLAVSGESPKIKILNVRTGELVKTLIGHGAPVNDLATSPKNPQLLASGSKDHSIRIWHLDPKYAKQPTAVICSGEGHKEAVLTVAWHRTGRYLLSGGMDTIVNLWVLPDVPNEKTGTDKVSMVHYPHFSTTEIHSDFVDCVAFYDDLILSRSAKENRILLWRITNFSSSAAPPPPSTAPPPSSKTSASTRSAFVPDDETDRTTPAPAKFQRLLAFDVPHSSLFYMRFGLFHAPSKRPILVIGNERSKIFWWDLQRLEEGLASSSSSSSSSTSVPAPDDAAAATAGAEQAVKHRHRAVAAGLAREASITSTASGQSGRSGHSSGAGGARRPGAKSGGHQQQPPLDDAVTIGGGAELSTAERRYSIADPFLQLQAHRTNVVGKVTFCARQAAWSVGGEWAVVVGDCGMICVWRRWD